MKLGLWGASLLIASTQLSLLARSRRAWAATGLLLLPALIAWLVAAANDKVTPSGLSTMLGWHALLGVSVPLASLLLGVAVIAEEVEDRTITYLLLRPVPRASLLFGRLVPAVLWLWASCAAGTALLVAAAATARGSDAGVSDGTRLPLLLAACAGVATYTALHAALGVWVKHAMIVGLAYSFTIEGFLSNLPGRNQSLTIQHHLRSLVAGTGDDAWQRIDGFGSTEWNPLFDAALVLALVVLVAFIAGAWRLARRQFELPA